MLVEDPVEASLRAMWPLVFSREEPVREAVVDAIYNLYLRDGEGECGHRRGAGKIGAGTEGGGTGGGGEWGGREVGWRERLGRALEEAVDDDV